MTLTPFFVGTFSPKQLQILAGFHVFLNLSFESNQFVSGRDFEKFLAGEHFKHCHCYSSILTERQRERERRNKFSLFFFFCILGIQPEPFPFGKLRTLKTKKPFGFGVNVSLGDNRKWEFGGARRSLKSSEDPPHSKIQNPTTPCQNDKNQIS